MSVFTKRINPLTGQAEWELQDESYDFHQEIARSAFADMLHDTERNEKYYKAIRRAVERKHGLGQKAHVLDIGTGTGLLSMMAAACGADTVVACEAFPPMADCARKITAKNGFKDKIRVISKHSTDLIVGENGDLKYRANILVTEVFDTELIGEGAIKVFNHAHKELLEKDCIVVPMSGTLYCQVVESPLAQSWNKMNSIMNTAKDPKILIDTPPEVWNCPGAAGVHDIQLSQFPQSEFQTIVSPQPVMRFDWSGRSPLPSEFSNILVSKAEKDGVAQLVFAWWDLVMDVDGEIVLSCAPVWAHPLTRGEGSADDLPWRDHWMQAVYYLPKEVDVKEGQEITIICTRDEYSFWFNACENLRISEIDYQRPLCDCGLHAGFSRTRIGAMNDSERIRKYIAALEPLITDESSCLCLSEGTLLGLVAAKLGARKVYCIESNVLAKRALEEFIRHNYLQEKVVLMDSVETLKKHQELEGQVNVVLGEPHFFTTLLPWHNAYFWYMKQEISSLLSPCTTILPAEATVWAMAVEFKDLYKIRAPLCNVEGFAVAEFDKLIEHSSSISDSAVEAHPLWEYPCRALTRPFQILNFSFNKNVADCAIHKEGEVHCEGSGICHGVVMWVYWDLDGNPKHGITTGPVEMVNIGERVKWDMHTRQGVYFFNEFHHVGELEDSCVIKFSGKFLPHSGLSFHFSIK
ncbi:hypothetical protein R5R35_005767 [Gryllus longicercus]